MKEKSDSFRGQIGSNISQSRIEVEENILRLLYEWWIQEKRLDKNEICKAMGLNRRQLAYYIHSMIEHGYIRISRIFFSLPVGWKKKLQRRVPAVWSMLSGKK